MVKNDIFRVKPDAMKKFIKKVSKDNVTTNYSILTNQRKCTEIIDDVIRRMNKYVYFNEDISPDESIVENVECWKIKLHEVGSYLHENEDIVYSNITDMKLSEFLVDCNREDGYDDDKFLIEGKL